LRWIWKRNLRTLKEIVESRTPIGRAEPTR
jgi:hypothetical protein